MAFVLALIVFVLGTGCSILLPMAGSMSDNVSAGRAAGSNALLSFVITCVITTLIIGSHYLHWAW